MIVELDISLLTKLGNLTLNQLVFLSLVLSKNQPKHQQLRSLFSLMNSSEIHELVKDGYITVTTESGNIKYLPTDFLLQKVGKAEDMFDQFKDAYPVYVVRPDNTKDYLRTNINKCRKFYNQLVGGSRAQHEHIMSCLLHDLDKKATTGKLCYMKRMWQWLTSREWEAIEQEVEDTNITETQSIYGTEIKW